MRVWVEVSNKMPSNEYVFLICQTQTGRVITVHDNRDRLELELMNPGNENQEGVKAMQALFGGNNGRGGGTAAA